MCPNAAHQMIKQFFKFDRTADANTDNITFFFGHISMGTLCLLNGQIQWLDNRHRIRVYEEVDMLAID